MGLCFSITDEPSSSVFHVHLSLFYPSSFNFLIFSSSLLIPSLIHFYFVVLLLFFCWCIFPSFLSCFSYWHKVWWHGHFLAVSMWNQWMEPTPVKESLLFNLGLHLWALGWWIIGNLATRVIRNVDMKTLALISLPKWTSPHILFQELLTSLDLGSCWQAGTTHILLTFFFFLLSLNFGSVYFRCIH